eukprot:510809_1
MIENDMEENIADEDISAPKGSFIIQELHNVLNGFSKLPKKYLVLNTFAEAFRVSMAGDDPEENKSALVSDDNDGGDNGEEPEEKKSSAPVVPNVNVGGDNSEEPEEKQSVAPVVHNANVGGDNDSTFYVSHWQYQGFDPSEKPMDYLQDLDMKIEDAYQHRTKDTKEVELGSINGSSGFYIKFDYDDWMSGFQLRRDNNVVDRYPTSVRLVTRKTDDQYDEDTTTTSMRKIFEDTSL